MKHINEVKKYCAQLGTAAGLALASTGAMAQSYDTLTAAVDWSDVASALLAVGAAIIGIMVVFKGVKLVVRAVKGA